MTTTGYVDTFSRTVSGGLGVATSGQTYTLTGGTAAQYSVAPGTASIAVNASGNWLGYIDRQTADIDITGQVALSAIPATNQTLVGFTAKQSTNQNYYIGTLMVQNTTNVMSLRISKVITGGLVTLNTTLVPGLGTYTVNTYFNIRFQCYWSNLLQTNVLNMKIWAVGGTEPGGWLISITDNAITQYASGTQAGLYARDEATSPGNTALFRNVFTRSYSLPMPATTDPMCSDPSVAYPKQPVLESLAQAADAQITTFDPSVSLAALYPRVRISSTNVSLASTGPDITFTTTEFNVGTPTNLAYDAQALYLPVGIWLCTFEIILGYGASASGYVSTGDSGGPSAGTVRSMMRSNPAISLANHGGSAHASALTFSTDPANPVRYVASMFINVVATTYTVSYMALSAIKISDYFS